MGIVSLYQKKGANALFVVSGQIYNFQDKQFWENMVASVLLACFQMEAVVQFLILEEFSLTDYCRLTGMDALH